MRSMLIGGPSHPFRPKQRLNALLKFYSFFLFDTRRAIPARETILT